MESIEHSGLWWLPGSPDHKVAGTLKYSDKGGGRLELIGSFRGEGDSPRIARTYPIILGFSTTRGAKITLLDSMTMSVSSIPLGFDEVNQERFLVETLYVNVALLGAHFPMIEEARFSHVIIELGNLTDFMAAQTGHIKHEGTGGGGEILQVTYTWPEYTPAVTTRGTVSICHSPRVSYKGSGGANVEEQANLQVASREELDFGTLRQRFLLPLQMFVSLVTGRWSSVDHVIVRTERRAAPQHPDLLTPVSAHFMPPNHDHAHEQWTPPLFTLEQIAGDFGDVIDRWLTITERYQAPCELFFAVMRTPSLYLENQFLNLAQAVESFHRIRSGIEVMNLRVRLAELVEEVYDMVPWATGNRGMDNAWPFVDLVVDTRNYYTHRNEGRRERAAHSMELTELAACLYQVVYAALVRELQLPEEVYVTMFSDRHLERSPGRRW